MLKAKYQNQILDLSKLSRSEMNFVVSHRKDFLCPNCNTSVILKYGPKKKPHFAHQTSCIYEYTENESIAHRAAKRLLMSWLMIQGAVNVSEEYRIPSINRIADLYFEFQNTPYVIEIQKSSISEMVFNARNEDYQSLNIKVIWIFIGHLTQSNQTYYLNQQMKLNRENKLIHLNPFTEKIIILNSIIWISSKEVKARENSFLLKHVSISELLEEKQSSLMFKIEDWMLIKRKFRQSKWFTYMKAERTLRELCLRYRFNLSLMPAEVGWPIINNHGFQKPLFIWQSYIVVGIIMAEKIGDVLTIGQIIQLLKRRFKLQLNGQAVNELKIYLDWLVKWQILKKQYGYYEILKHPVLFQTLEQAFEADYLLAQTYYLG